MTWQQILAQQQVVIGMVGAAAIGGLLFALRQIPGKLVALLVEAFAVTLILDSDDETYSHVNLWLARHGATRRARRLMLEQGYDYAAGKWGWEFTLGQGWHLLVYSSRLLLVHRHVQAAEGLDRMFGGGKRQRLTIYSVGRSQAAIRALIADARAAYMGDGLVQVFFWHQGCFMLADRRAKRPVGTVFMPSAQKARIVDDLIRFVGERETYRRRGIPHRRGVLLEGPPGTGKSTLIFVAAGVLGRAVYSINLNNIGGDNELLSAFNHVGSDAVIALEDVDTCRISRDRDGASSGVQPAAGTTLVGTLGPSTGANVGVTLSGLLNAIDGIASREGRILFMTSNHADQLDPALLRSGRVDVREVIDRLGREDAMAMFHAFRPEGTAAEFDRMTKGRLPMSAADLQNLLLAPPSVTTFSRQSEVA